MNVPDIRYLYDYSSWANAKLLRVVSQLPADQFTRPIAGSYGSIRSTLVHALSAEWGWLERCGGPRRGNRLEPADYPTPATVAETWRLVEAWMRDFLAELTDEQLAEEVAFSFGDGPTLSLPRGELLLHTVIHAVHHRGQVALLLRTIGCAPGNVDLLIYAGDRARVAT